MFNSISWQEFFYTVALVVGGYYIITTLLLYSSNLANIFKQKKRNFRNGKVSQDQTRSKESLDLMGAVRYEASRELNVPREEQISSEDIVATPTKEPEEPIEVARERSPEDALALAVTEVKDGIKAIVTSDPACSKEDFITLLQALLSHYPQLGDSIHRVEIYDFIIESCQEHFEFEMQPKEIISLWPQGESHQS